MESEKSSQVNDHSTELSPLNSTKEELEKAQDEVKKQKRTLKEKLIHIKNNITVEPVMACYIMPSVLASLAMQNLNLEKACRVNLNFTQEVCDALTLRQTENYTYYEEEVQKLIASIQTWKNIVQTTIPVCVILFVGAWSDKTGRRKACILTPIIGELLSTLGFIVNTYFFYELPVEVTALTESIFPAITGGWFTNFIGVFSYIGDITTAEDRTYRVGMVNMFMSLGYPIGSALSGVLLAWVGYYGVFSITASLYIFSLTYGYFYLKDPNRKPKDEKYSGLIGFLREFFDTKLVAETFRVAFKKGPGNRRLRVALLLIVVCVVFGPLHGESTIIYLYTRYKFNWNEVQFSAWATYCSVTYLAGTLFSITLFSKYMKLDDTLLGIISNTSKIVSAFGYAFARTDFEMYMAVLLEILNGTSFIAMRSIATKLVSGEEFAVLLEILNGTSFIAMRSIATKLVSGEEFGKVNSLFGLAEAAMPLVYGPMYSRVYMVTLNVFPGAVFLLGALLTVPSFLIFGWLYFEHKKDRKRDETAKLNDGEKQDIKENT